MLETDRQRLNFRKMQEDRWKLIEHISVSSINHGLYPKHKVLKMRLDHTSYLTHWREVKIHLAEASTLHFELEETETISKVVQLTRQRLDPIIGASSALMPLRRVFTVWNIFFCGVIVDNVCLKDSVALAPLSSLFPPAACHEQTTKGIRTTAATIPLSGKAFLLP